MNFQKRNLFRGALTLLFLFASSAGLWLIPNSPLEDLVRSLALNTSLRQTFGSTPRFTDVSGDLGLFAEYATARGSTNRDFDFTPTGMIAASGTSFTAGLVNRLDLAVALVKQLSHVVYDRRLTFSFPRTSAGG